ncbi:PAS domain-containing sensor histidine kinase [Zhengella mangrovi]|nr:PAS domain-containing sensor histidine kinase [Zhengella mangrovi]
MTSLRSLGDRLLHPRVKDPEARQAQLRLFALALGAQPVFAFAFFATAAAILPFAYVLAVAGIVAVCALAMVATVSLTGRDGFAGLAGLVVLSTVCAAILAMTGGLSGPIALLAAVPAAEAWWVRRSKPALLTGLAFSVAIVLSQGLLGPIAQQAAPAWLVLAPLAWVASLVLRLYASEAGRTAATREAEEAGAASDLQPVVVLSLDEDGQVLSASHKARSVMGLHPGLLIGGGLFERMLVTDRVEWLTAVADMREGAATRETVVRIRLPETGKGASGQMHAFHAHFARNWNGTLTVFLADDARTERLREELRAVQDNAESASIAKNRFLASVSHELRTPLNAIIGFADILDQELFGGFEDPRQKEYVGLISKSGAHLLSVVNAILDVSKIESGAYAIHAEAFDFTEAAAMPRSIALQQASSKNIRLETVFGTDLGDLVADRRAIQQILINLLSNAVKFTPDGGDVTLGARRTGDQFTFWVNDSGIGIAESDLKRLGQPFMQVQNDYTRNFEGTGLGLSLVKGLVQLHGGTIAIDSAPGEGTCVSVTLAASGAKCRMHRLPNAEQEDMTSHGPYRKTA